MINLANLRQIAEEKLQVPAKLHEYQWEGVAFLYQSRAALLADEMGLGKTVQAAVAMSLLLNTRNDINRALIVSPSSLTTNWAEELATWAPLITARQVKGNIQNRKACYLLPIPVLVASYDHIRVDGLDQISANTFDLVVLDEAQRIKNKESITALACRLLPRQCAWALTATPLENDEADISSILSFLAPHEDRGLSKNQLSTKLASMMLRRKKSQVRSELPPVILQELRINMSKPQRMQYDDLWVSRTDIIRQGVDSQNVNATMLGIITRLKIICNYDMVTGSSSKLDALQTICEGAGSSARILVFSQFVETLQWIAQRLSIPHDFLTGSMTNDKRQESIARFKKEDAPRALLVSLRAGGVGLNLGEASHVILFDRWWNPAVESQAIYRAHRFERKSPLHVIRFLTVDSVEERIVSILKIKEDIFNEVIESAKAKPYRFTQEELMRILQISEGDVFPTHLTDGGH